MGFCDCRCYPSLGLFKFFEGVIELLLRLILSVFAIAAMVPSALVFSLGDEALYEILNRMEIAIQELDSRSLPVPGSLQEFMDEGNAGTLASGGVVFGIAMIAFTYHASVIPVRLHVTCINDFPNSFLCMDILFNVFFAAGYFGGAITAAVFAADLGDFIDPGNPLQIIFLGESDPFQVTKIRNALAATAAFGILNAILCLLHALWMLLFRIFRWNEKLEAKA